MSRLCPTAPSDVSVIMSVSDYDNMADTFARAPEAEADCGDSWDMTTRTVGEGDHNHQGNLN